MTDENPPLDALAIHAGEVVHAAIQWYRRQAPDPSLNIEEWRLYSAVEKYGTTYRGVRSQ